MAQWKFASTFPKSWLSRSLSNF